MLPVSGKDDASRCFLLRKLATPVCSNHYRRFNLWFPVVRAETAPVTIPAASTENVVMEVITGKDESTRPKFVYTPIPGETGWDRLNSLYSANIFGELGPEWNTIRHSAFLGFFGGLLAGAFQGANDAKDAFVEKNQGTLYTNEYFGRRALQDRILIAMAKDGVKMGCKVAFLSFIYVGAVVHLSVYANETYVANFVAAGAISGAVYKFFQGPKAVVVASSLGAILGLMAGGMSKFLFYVSGTSFEEMRQLHYHYYSTRQSEVQHKEAKTKIRIKPLELMIEVIKKEDQNKESKTESETKK